MGHDRDLARTFARNLKRIMTERPMTQGQLSALSGVSQSHISLLLRGKRNPSIDVIERLAEAVGCEPTALLQDNY